MGWIYPAMANARGIWIEDIGGVRYPAEVRTVSTGLTRKCSK